VAPELTSLDIIAPRREGDCAAAPVVIWAHGGGWARGDKANGMDDKVAFFVDQLGYVLVSVNHRLSPWPPRPKDSARVKHPAHVDDVVRAIRYVGAHVAEFGGDPARLALLGHSSGAQLVALIGADPERLSEAVGPSATIRCIGSYDGSYDVEGEVAAAPEGSPRRAVLVNAFGDSPSAWRDASPLARSLVGFGVPLVQTARRGAWARRSQHDRFVERVRAAGASVDIIDATALDHEEIQRSLGAPGSVMMKAVEAFMGRCFEAATEPAGR